ncbi:hypothetical protein MJI12_28050, partial [Salmonella enterica subsp. enterica serovar Kentucky]|nr:hypothetical protein [Salmonella enterica subsp. enterica serovar Kentucky]
MNAGTPKTGAWRGVVVVRHFVALRDESDALVECSTRKIADSGQCCTVTEAIPPGTRYHINAFYFTGCGLQRRPALLPRDRKI